MDALTRRRIKLLAADDLALLERLGKDRTVMGSELYKAAAELAGLLGYCLLDADAAEHEVQRRPVASIVGVSPCQLTDEELDIGDGRHIDRIGVWGNHNDPDEYHVLFRTAPDQQNYGFAVTGNGGPPNEREAVILAKGALANQDESGIVMVDTDDAAELWRRAGIPHSTPHEHIENRDPTPDGDRLLDEALTHEEAPKTVKRDVFPWERFYGKN